MVGVQAGGGQAVGAEPALDLHMRSQGRKSAGWGPGTVVAASSVLHLNLRGDGGDRSGEKVPGPSAKYPPPSSSSCPRRGRGKPPRVLTQYRKLRLLTAAGMEGPGEQGGSDGDERGERGVCLAQKGRGAAGQRRVRGKWGW